MSVLQVLCIVILSSTIVCASESVTNTQLLPRIESLEIKDSEKSARVFALEQQCQESERKLQQLAEHNDVLEGKLRQLAERNDVLEGKLRQLAESNEDLEGKLQQLADPNEVLTEVLRNYCCKLKTDEKPIHELKPEVQQLLNFSERQGESVTVTKFQLNDLDLVNSIYAETNKGLFISGKQSMKTEAREKRTVPSPKILAQQTKIKQHPKLKQLKQQQNTEYSTDNNQQESNITLSISNLVNNARYTTELPRRLDTRTPDILTAETADILRANRDSTVNPVAFHAVIYDAINLIRQIGRPVMFSRTLLNLGDGFRSALGLFIAPRAGLYLFSDSLMCKHAEVQAVIVKRDLQLARVYCPRYDGVQGSVTVATQLNVGDDVWIRFDYPPNSHVWGNGFSSFTGVLVTPF